MAQLTEMTLMDAWASQKRFKDGQVIINYRFTLPARRVRLRGLRGGGLHLRRPVRGVLHGPYDA